MATKWLKKNQDVHVFARSESAILKARVVIVNRALGDGREYQEGVRYEGDTDPFEDGAYQTAFYNCGIYQGWPSK